MKTPTKKQLALVLLTLFPATTSVCAAAEVAAPPRDEKVILTPKPGPEPRINGPKVFGARPGKPFVYRIPATGQRPMEFAADNLPAGLSLNPSTGIITGCVPKQRGRYVVTLRATNNHGAAERPFAIAVGDTLALTPPMGWNSWYIHYHRVTGKVMREAANQMVASGMADFGYMYVNIDDCWMRITPEGYQRVKERFGDYDMTGVWQWGAEVGGNCWRTTGDLGLVHDTELPGFYHIGLSNAQHWQYAKPGAWNDPDYILIGWVGQARGHGVGKPTTLTGNQQYSYMSMWCLMASPLIFSGDMARLDEFTLNVLCNPEVIDVDQDPLGRQAEPIVQTDTRLVLAKPMEDGSVAVGLFNLDETGQSISVTWQQLGLTGKQRVRDLWRYQDIGSFNGKYEASVPRHGVMLVRLRPAH